MVEAVVNSWRLVLEEASRVSVDLRALTIPRWISSVCSGGNVVGR